MVSSAGACCSARVSYYASSECDRDGGFGQKLGGAGSPRPFARALELDDAAAVIVLVHDAMTK